MGNSYATYKYEMYMNINTDIIEGVEGSRWWVNFLNVVSTKPKKKRLLRGHIWSELCILAWFYKVIGFRYQIISLLLLKATIR